MSKLSVLIAEDNPDIAENIGDYLELKGHQVDYAYDGKMAVSLVQSQHFDVIIMDIMMPKLNGIQATQQIRTLSNGDIPILMLTAKDTLDDKLTGLDSGADDYIIKPFEITELYARIKAQSRKITKSYHHQINLNGIQLDSKQQSASIKGQNLNLNPTTFKIMWQLCKVYPNLLAKNEIEFLLWGEAKPEKDILRSHIYNLRQSIAKCNEQVTIVGKHGKGYLLNLAIK